ncbi:MAG: hypothetical protein ACTFAL_11895 [Candidatus Electronema sp. V4]|uniref:hypothetical protein n=1 Tax=Candidatus Electronema sp. V4 TaxID=3454756 RepID=UPI0040556AA5
MSVQTYLVHLRDILDEDAHADVAETISNLGGFILMALSTGGLIVAFDERHLSQIKTNRHVEFCSGVTLDPKGAAAKQLRLLFAKNVAAQLASRETHQAGQPVDNPAFPLGYRPLVWHHPA